MAVEGGQTSGRAWIPKFHLVVFRARNQQAFGGMPITRLDIPVMTGEDGVASTRGKIKDFEGGVIRGGEEFRVTGCPGQIANRVMMCVVNRFDVVEVRSPVLDVTSLSTRNQPFVAMRPA